MCFHPATMPEGNGGNAGAGQDLWHTEPYVWLQLWWTEGDAGEGVRILQWFPSWSEIPGVCKAVPGLCYTSAATLLLLSCSTYPEKPRSRAEAVNFVSFSLSSKCGCQHLQQDTSWSYAHVLTLCIYPCYKQTIPALRHEGQESKA